MGSGSGIDKPSDSLHYPDWAMQMGALLEEKELWDIVTGTKPVPTTGPNLKAMKAYVWKGKVAKAKIILHLDKSQLPHVCSILPKRSGTTSLVFIALTVLALSLPCAENSSTWSWMKKNQWRHGLPLFKTLHTILRLLILRSWTLTLSLH
jgi:hypothetical protein